MTSTDAAPVLRVAGVAKRFAGDPAPALDAIDLIAGAGETIGLVGPDGGGKSTLLRLIAGLDRPDAGSIALNGVAVGAADRRLVGYMPQSAGLYDDLTVLENLTLFADLRGLAGDGRDAVFARMLGATGLAAFQGRLAGQLSGGMRQKLGLICAMAGDPPLLLLDEPSVGVDPVSRRELWRVVADLAGAGTTVIWATSNLDEAEACDRIWLLHEGRLLHDGPPADLTARCTGRVFTLAQSGGPARRMVAAALASDDVVDATIQGGSVRLLMQEGAARPETGVLSHLNVPASRPARPRLEDAFLDRLGGARGVASPLASQYRTIPTDGGPMIEAQGLMRQFGDFVAVDGLTLAVPRGQVFGLLGPNGAGKTTSFRMLCGLIRPTGGAGRVAGHDVVADPGGVHGAIGYMAQKFSLYADLSVRQNLNFFAGAYGLSGAARRAEVERALALFALEPMAGRDAGALGPGFRQRLSLACAIMHQPPVLFLDEPTSGVDPIARREFWSHINAMAGCGVTVFVTTHFMDEAEYCDRIALIFRSRMIAAGTPDALKADVAAATGMADPTLEDAFLALIERDQRAVAA